jgi:serine/threonine-protein kinase
MADEKWQKVREIFDSALRQKPDVRRRFVNDVCGDDKTLFAEVESLLSSLDNAESFMETPAVAEVADVIEAEQKRLEAGKRFGHYEIIEQIGVGGMGEVYLARDKKLDRKVAVKILRDNFSQHELNLQRFIREAKSASALNHPNILVIHEIGETDEARYIVSEFVEGKTLREMFAEKPFTLSEVLDISIQIADALCAAHSSNIIHRDIKPENIMVRPDGVVKVLDFGLAKLVEQKNLSMFDLEESPQQQRQTAQGLILGTVSYMSPEQARGLPVDARTDIFSFGILLYELLTGAQPFTGDTGSHTIVAILEKEPPPVSRFIDSYPPEIERIIKKCLAKQPDERYGAAKGLLDDLKELREELAFQSKLERKSAPHKRVGAERPMTRAATTAETEKRNSIAVLPFTNMSAEADNEYFCDGLAEELLNTLARIEDLKVAARTSAFSFKNKNVEISEIGKTLNVRTVLEGSVRKSGDRLRISVQLVNAADGYHLWSERYDRQMRDIFDVQDEIALAVVDALKVRLLGEEKAAILKRYTDNPEAYELYLKGEYLWLNRRKENWAEQILTYYQRALEKDPNFALAHIGIAQCYIRLSGQQKTPGREAEGKAKSSIMKALEIVGDLAQAHNALAELKYQYEYDWAGAEVEFKKAIELNPNVAAIRLAYGWYLMLAARFGEASLEFEKARELDPSSLTINVSKGRLLYFSRQYDQARQHFQNFIPVEPNSAAAYLSLFQIYQQKQMYAEALEAFIEYQSLIGAPPESSEELRRAFNVSGYHGFLRKLLAAVEARAVTEYVSPAEFAELYAHLGQKEEALAWLEKTFDERAPFIVQLKVHPAFDSLRDDPRFRDLLRRVGLH